MTEPNGGHILDDASLEAILRGEPLPPSAPVVISLTKQGWVSIAMPVAEWEFIALCLADGATDTFQRLLEAVTAHARERGAT